MGYSETFSIHRHTEKKPIDPAVEEDYPGITEQGQDMVRKQTREHLLKVIEDSDPNSVVMFLGASDLPRTKSTTHVSANEVKSLLADQADKYLVLEQKDIEGIVDKKTQSTREVLSKLVAANPDKKVVLTYPLFLKEFSLITPESGPGASKPDWKTGGVKEIGTPYLAELMKQANKNEAVAVSKWIENGGKITMPNGSVLEGPNPIETAQGYIKALTRMRDFVKELFPGRPLVIQVSTHSFDIDAFIAYATHQGKLDVKSFEEIAKGNNPDREISTISSFEAPLIKIGDNEKTLSYRGKTYELNSPEFTK